MLHIVGMVDAASSAEPRVVEVDDAARWSPWIAKLGSERFAEREIATRTLIEAGQPAISSLIEVVGHRDAEVRARAIFVLQRFAQSDQIATRQAARLALEQLAASGDGLSSRAAKRALSQFAQQAARQLEMRGARLTWDEHDQVRTVSFAHRKIRDDDLRPLNELQPTELDLRFTSVSDGGLEYVRGQTQLEVLNLQATDVTDQGLSQLQDLRNLRTLSLERTAVTDAGMAHLQHFEKLEILYLGGSRVRGSGLQWLRDLKVSYLSFQGSDIDDSVADHLAALRHIKTLGLDETAVTDACLPALADLPELEVLWLNKTQVTDACSEPLQRLRQLRTLHIENTRMSPEGLQKLEYDLKDVEVVHPPRRR